MKYTKLTPYQSIFYYEWLNNPSRSDYNIVIDNTVTGKLNPQRYNESFEQLLNEHFITRHVIKDTKQGLCWQLVEPIVNLTTFHETPLTDEQIYALVTEPFDLHHGPLVRIHLIKLADERYRMIFIFHHIVVDGISTAEIWDKWRNLYNGVTYQVPALADQTMMHQSLYDYFEQLFAEHSSTMRAFWQKHLQGIQGVDLSFLQTTHKPKNQSISSFTEYLFSYDEHVTKQVNALRRQYKITPYLFGQMVMATLLHKMSGNNNIALAYPIAILEGKELLYGSHINTMIIDYRFDEHTTLDALIKQTLSFYKDLKTSHAKYLPINEIIRCGGDPSILNIAFAQTFYRDHEAGLMNVKNESVNHEFQVDLASTLLFEQQEHNHQINYRVRFDSQILDQNLIKNLMLYYQKLFIEMLTALTSGQAKTVINNIDLIEPKQFLATTLTKAIEQPVSNNVVTQFEEIANKYPERIAVIYNDNKLTYQQLNQYSNQLAHHLISHYELQPDDLVALCLEKSAFMPISILAVLKTGAAYVPLDPKAPKQRLSYILQDTKAKVILSEQSANDYLASVINETQTPLICLDNPEFSHKLLTTDLDNLNINLHPHQLAYVIYTSGTTGLPKGVMLEHIGLGNLAAVQGNAFGLAFDSHNTKNCLWYASYVFDAHVSEMFTAIANGHVLHILNETCRLDFNLLADYIDNQHIDIATIPPALLNKDHLLKLSTLVVAGESCNIEIMERYCQQGTQVINAYGPTESTVCATLHHYQHGDNNLNIGLPLINLDAYVLDKNLKPVPAGVIGDLYIGGIALARGYLNNPQQTDQSFINHPFKMDAHSSQRVYKTGDLARQMLDGTIEYAGRKDFQVKIRGHRIELAEIENSLIQMPHISQAAVLAHTLNTGLKSLVAYYIAPQAIDENQILQYLSDYLPEYMLPNAFVHMNDFPLTVNGKLDRTALPEPNFTQQTVYCAPCNKIETVLCKIYAEVLGIDGDKIGIHDDFFKLGGDSISGILLVSKIRHKLNASVSIKDIFATKTVHLLAKCISAGKIEQNTVIVTEKGQLSGTFKLLPIQQWFFERVQHGQFLDYQHWNQAFILDVPKLDVPLLQQSLNILVSYHDALRLTFYRDQDGQYCQQYHTEINDIKFDAINLAHSNSTEQQLFEQWQLGFDIENGPLFHVGYIESEHSQLAKIHFALHHLIIDAISWHIIKQDLQTIYQTLLTHRQASCSAVDILGEKSSSYRQWVAQIHDYVNQGQVEQEKAYWLTMTEGIECYRQKVIPLFKHERLNSVTRQLDCVYTTNLQSKIHRVLSTQVNDVLLASFVHVLKQFTGIEQQYITLEGHGREALSSRIDVNRTVGWFTNMYPIALVAKSHVLTHVAQIKDCLSAVPSRGIGFAPLFGYQDTMLSPIGFNYLGQFDGTSTEEWQFSLMDHGTAISSKNRMMNVLNLDCGIVGGELKIKLSGYLENSKLEQLAENYIALLQITIDQLANSDRSYLTTADINYTLSANQLEQLQKHVEIESIYLANSLQEGFIYHAISQGDIDDAYRTQMFWDYENELDVELLKKAWQSLQNNYPSLRLRFNWDEELVQIIDKTAELNWSYYDISNQSAHQQQIFLTELYKQDRNQAYDLSVAGLFRVYLIKRSEQHYSCVFSSHHAILDGWSNPILIKAVHDIYIALLNKYPCSQCKDHSYPLVQEYLQANRAEHLDYWQQYLARQETKEDLSLLLASHAKGLLLSDYKHITKPSHKTLSLDANIFLALKGITTQYALTTNAILQYCWHKVLSVYTGSSDTIVGVVVAGRNLPVDGIEQTVGLLINTLPLIVNHQPSISLCDVIGTLQHDIHEANSRSNVNLANLQQSGERLFNSLFVFENYPIPENCFEHELTLNFLGSEEKQDYPLVMTVLEEEQRIALNLHYAGELFEDDVIDHLLTTFKRIVMQIVAQPHTKQNEISYLDEQQYQTIIYDWNKTACNYFPEETAIRLFEQQVERTPNHLAVLFNDITLTYQQLNQSANQLADYLQTQYQLKANELVGLYLDRSEQMVVSILAVLKAGAAYVPMDTDAPDERNQYIIDDAKINTIITCQSHQAKVSQFVDNLINIDQPQLRTELLQYNVNNPKNQTTGHDLAYCIYTSGTTGKPKGTLINHNNINRLALNPDYTQITSDDRILAISGYQFDASIYDIFASLFNGASVVIVEKHILLDLIKFNQLLTDKKISNCFITTAFFNTLVDAKLSNLAQLNYVLVGGEALSVDHVNRFRRYYPNVKLANIYGPTETTTYAVSYLTNQVDIEFNHSVPIGRAINNTTLYVLNSELCPVPLGAVGELYIGGAGVGRGYLNNSALTAKTFVHNPFQSELERAQGYNDRIYKTGDLVRYLKDGNIEYLGRNDFQVKIRGFRIELAEIEAKLIKYPAIKQAIVIANDNGMGDKQLIAYYVAEKLINREQLFDYLKQSLPEYMIPAAFIYLEALPLNINGKVNRAALPAATIDTQTHYVAPINQTQQVICQCYAQLLGLNIDSISVTDDFFRMGGNSILAIKLASRLTANFAKTVHVADIFKFKTIEALSQFIEQDLTDQALSITIRTVDCVQDQVLSFAQERLWFIDSYEGGSDAYNIPLTLLLKPTISLVNIIKALNKVIERHEVLRTLIKTNAQGEGYQQVIAADEIELESCHTICDTLDELNSHISRHVHCVFDLANQIPLSVASYQLAEKTYLSIVIHHIAFDGWSIELLSKELNHYYMFYGDSNNIPELPNIDVQYKDFALWQREYLQGERLQSQLDYWYSTLEDYQALNLATDYVRPLNIDYRGQDIPFKLTTQTSQQLRQLAADLNVSLYTVLLSGYYLFLKGYSNQSDIILGSPIAGRHYPGIENTLGFFVNTLALRRQINDQDNLADFIKATGNLLRDAQQYQDLPFEKLVDGLQVEKDLSRHPLFQVMFSVQSFGFDDVDTDNSIFTPYMTDNAQYKVAKFDLSTMIDDSQASIRGIFNYATALFKPETVERFIEVYCYILEQLSDLVKQQQPISRLSYLNDTQYQTIIYDWNQTEGDYRADKTVIDLFEEQVKWFAHSPAVMFNDLILTYEALNQQANQLAHYLKTTYDIKPNDFVGLYLNRSEQIVVSMLAVLKAGAAYVPIDPDTPNERNAYIIQDANVKAVITQACYEAKIKQFSRDVSLVVVDKEHIRNTISLQCNKNVSVTTKPTDLAYIIYTSGTTGKPKGTLICHYNINRLVVKPCYTEISPNDRFLDISGYQFDASIYDIFGPLLNGASVVIAKKECFLDLEQFNQLLSDYKISNCFITAAFFNTLVDADVPNLGLLKYILVGGEALSVYHINHFRQRHPQVKLVNGYGPTETTTFAVTYLINSAEKPFSYSVPIGRPINNTSLYILDSYLRPVPLGGIGELYIGGEGVGLGYLNNPELTGNVFLVNPFQSEQQHLEERNARLYKTGDLVRYLPDGNVEYLGRNDFQVKIRGFRIELAEIEACLHRHPSIKQTIVLANTDASGNKYLVAYYVADEVIGRDQLYDYLLEHLPEYMIPSAFMYLDAMPLTINGKVNRAALPTISQDTTAECIAPTTVTEKQVARLFAQLLKLELDQISVTDDFFRMGGNSILAIKLASCLVDSCSKTVHVADIFNHRTIRALSQYIDTQAGQQYTILAQDIEQVEQQLLSFAQERLWFIDSYEGGSDAYNIPLTLKLNKNISLTILANVLNKIIERHEILRTIIKSNSQGEGYQQVLCSKDAKLSIPHKKCQHLDELHHSIMEHVHCIFNLASQIPISAQSYQLEDEIYLSLVIHHIAFDGWSIDLLIKELNHYYQAFTATGEVIELPSVSVQYKDFAIWQRQYLQGEKLQSQLNYWQSELADHQPLNLPLDYPRPLQIDYRGEDVNFSLSLSVSQTLRQLAANLNVSLYTVLLSGYYLMLKAYSNQSDIILGTPIAGRHYLGIENTMGFFVNTLALRREIDDQTDLADFIQTTGQKLGEAQQYQDLPFEKLVDALTITQDPSRHPLFQVMFGVQSFGASNHPSEDCLFTPYDANSKQYNIAKFDLTTILDDSKACITGHFNYAKALFEAETINGYINVYCHILAQFGQLCEQHLPIAKLSYLDNSTYHQVIHDWNQTEHDYPTDKTLAQMFEEQVIRTPDHIAIVHDDMSFTYQQLNERANQLANYLHEQFSIQGDDLIAICLDKTPQIIISILAVLKAGAAYVPLSPKLPDERQQWIVDDTQCKAVITTLTYQANLNNILTQTNTQVVCLDDFNMQTTLANYSSLLTKSTATAQNLAYIIYTSGTTGNPKGVMIEHHSAINATFVQHEAMGLSLCNAGDKSKSTLWYSDYTFDAHVLDVFVPLLTGNCLHIFAQDKRLDLQALIDYVATHSIDYAFIPPVLLDKDRIIPIGRLLVGGEGLSQHIVDHYCEYERPLVNAYGPTEASIWATYHLYRKGDINTNIGKAIYNATLYVLDNILRPVPVGAIGELYIGGVGVGRGYLNNPTLTEKVFIDNPFQSDEQRLQRKNSRLYKTGDVVRYLADGSVEYLGRNDFQVKIRGFRIELAEIESRLLTHSAVKQALVLACDHRVGDKQLVAYYVAEEPISNDELFHYLQQSLPEYMIPVVFIHLDTIPLTLNGKVNRAALPQPSFNVSIDSIKPTTDTEILVATIYSELLSIPFDSISITDDFFRMGGNSILAIKLAAKLSDKTEKSVHISDIFNYKTIKALSEQIDANDAQFMVIEAPKIERVQDQLLSFAQERLWFIDNYEGGSHAYNIPLTLTLSSNVSLIALSKALVKIVERHEILRTIIKADSEGMGYQCVLAPDNVNVKINHLICQDVAMLDRYMTDHINQIFDLSKQIPISAQSYQLAEQHYLSIVIHHIAFDGWSVDLLIKELNYYYHFYSATNAQVDLPAVQVQYKDFALWQRKYLQAQRLQVQLDYWQKRLSDYQPLNLPIDYTRPMQIDYRGADCGFTLSESTSHKLRQLAADLNVSLYTLLLSGYYLLLRAYSNQSDIIVGTPIAGRHYPRIEDTMGFFVNTLALRREIEPQQNVADFIRQTGVLVSEAQQYQDLPFEKLVDALQIEKDPSRHPLFQVMFGLQSFGLADKTNTHELFKPYQANSTQYNVAKFDMTTMLDDSKTCISGNFNYATALFDRQTINEYINVYCYILEQLSELVIEHQPISRLNYLDEAHYDKVIHQWNDTREAYPNDKTIHQMFEEQVAKTPDNIAVVYENNRLSYGQLNEKANQLAHYLREHFAIKGDDLIALYLDRSLCMPVAILGVLKSGAAYVPIDPLAPGDRSHYILNNTQASVILTVTACYEKCKTLAKDGQIVINLQSPHIVEQLFAYSKTNPLPIAKANNLAYVIYTSGTTGNAKGVMLEHQSVINKIVWRHKQYPITEHDRILQKTNYSFDVSIWELFWANWYGASIIFAHSESYKDNIYLAELIMQEGITTLHFVPSMLSTFLETVEGQVSLRTQLASLRYLFCSGEALNLDDVKKCHRLIPHCQIHNLYGPTETTIEVSYYDCNDRNISKVLIGRPIANSTAYVLDDNLQAVPLGAIGELYIGGDAVARGYLYNPTLTDERFIANPFQHTNEKAENYNHRIYKTGDIVRYLADGNIEYLGRNDFQVKIRGYRIELNEIEACLGQHEQIIHAIVIAYERSAKDKYLVAYYVANTPLDDDELINHLRQSLPEYMVPVAFVHLDALPTTSNGKLDRKLLPQPEFNHTVAHILPANELERVLAEIFSDTLNIASSEISMEHSFFALGGNSILAMKLNSRINQVFQVRLSLVDILNARNIRELAIKIAETDKQEFNPVVPLTALSDKPQIFMIHPGMGGCSVYLSLANKLETYYCCYGVDSYNFYHDDKIDNLPKLAQYYLSYIDRVLDLTKPIVFMGWSLGGQIGLEIASILEARGLKDIKVIALDTWLLKAEDINEKEPLVDLDQLMAELNIPKYLRANVVSVSQVDKTIALQPISAKLNYTQVMLFKAMEEKGFGAANEGYQANNLGSCLRSTQQLSVIELETDHYKILEKDQTIIDNIRSFTSI